jgi:hypothetical protein
MDGIQLSQSSAIVSIQPTNQTEFTERSKLIFDIEPDIAFIKGRDSYLVLDVLNTSTKKNRWMFQTSAQSLIEQIDIFAGPTGGGLQLESLLQYNQVAGVQTPYTVNDPTPLQMKEGQREPIELLKVDSLRGAELDSIITCGTDDLAAVNGQMSPIKTDGTAKYTSRRLCLPIHSGLLSRWWDEKELLCPVAMMGGLRIEITFAEKEQVCAQIGTMQTISGVTKPRKTLAISGQTIGGSEVVATGCASVDATGLAVGNSLTLSGGVTGIVLTTDTLVGGTTYTAGTGVTTTGGTGTGLLVDTTVAVSPGPVTGITISDPGSGYTVGDVITIDGGTGDATFTVASVTDDESQVVTVSSISADGTDATITIAETLTNTYDLLTLDTDGRDYKVTKAELRVMQVVLPDSAVQSMLGKGMKYGFTSYDHFLDTVLTSSRKTVVDIPSVASKAKCIQSLLVDTSGEDDAYVSTYYSSAPPSKSLLNSVASYIDNKLYPLIPYNPGVRSDRCITLNELSKSFSSIGKVPESLGSSSKHDLDGYTNPFMYGRQLAEGDFVVSLREAEPQLRMGFSGTRASPFRAHTYVYSTKIIMSSGSGLAIEL